MSKHVKQWGPGYPEADTGPITPEEVARLARRMELEHPLAGRIGRAFPQDADARHCTGMELTEWE